MKALDSENPSMNKNLSDFSAIHISLFIVFFALPPLRDRVTCITAITDVARKSTLRLLDQT